MWLEESLGECYVGVCGEGGGEQSQGEDKLHVGVSGVNLYIARG